MTYLEIRNWREYQHYKERRPPWVKLHVKLLDDESQRDLSVHARLLSLLLLCVAARKDNKIPNNPAWLAEEVGLPARVLAKALDELLAISFLNRSENPMPRDRSSEQSSSTSSNGYVVPNRAFAKLLKALTDKDTKTEQTIRGLAKKHHLAEGDLEWAYECATGPGVKSPVRVAVAELKKRGEAKQAVA